MKQKPECRIKPAGNLIKVFVCLLTLFLNTQAINAQTVTVTEPAALKERSSACGTAEH